MDFQNEEKSKEKEFQKLKVAKEQLVFQLTMLTWTSYSKYFVMLSL